MTGNLTSTYPERKFESESLFNGYTLAQNWEKKILENRSKFSNLIRQLSNEETQSSSAASLTSLGTVVVLTNSEQLERNQSLNHITNLVFTSTCNPITELKEHVLEWLKNKGYILLHEKLTNNSGYPWDEIKMLRSPILMEQLIDIHLLLESKKDFNEKKLIMNFALKLVKFSHQIDLKDQISKKLLEETKQIIGKIIYLIDNDPKAVSEAVKSVSNKTAVTCIKESFSYCAQKMCQRLREQYMAHCATQLQSPDIALHTLIPVEIANALITEIGTINVGIIDILADIFLSNESRHINHEANLSYALKILQQSPQLRFDFEKIHAPTSSNLPSNEVIRVTFNLPPTVPITDLQTRKAALVALLSHLRSGGDGSCFAVSLAIEILSSHLSYCFKDMAQILQESKLSRTIKGVRIDIPFIKKIHDKNLNTFISFDDKGYLYQSKEKLAPLWTTPGIIAAATALNLLDCRQAIEKIIARLIVSKNEQLHTVQIKFILKQLAELASVDKDPQMVAELYSKARFAFSSLISQPLLKIWGNAIAGMAEVEEGSMVKSAILRTTLDALQYHLGKKRIPATPFMMKFFLTAQKNLFNTVNLQYDPSALENESQFSSEDGFVLHKKNVRVDNPETFRLFLHEILQETKGNLEKEGLSKEDDAQLKKAIELLTLHIDTKDFIGYLLARYDESNKKAVEELSKGKPINFSALKMTPWITQTGNNSKAVLNVYLGTETLKKEQFISNGALEALVNIIEMCKNMPEEEKKLFLLNPNKLKPFCILGMHRLPFMAGNSSLSNAWQKDIPTEKWIELYVLQPGREICTTQMDRLTRTNLIKKLQIDVLATLIPSDKIQMCIEEIQAIQDPILIKDFRHTIMRICETKYHFDSKKLARYIDTALCQSLNPLLQKKLEDSAVHFADTNWSHNIHDIHLCFAVNPSTGDLELWEAYSNGSNLVALDQSYWLCKQKWEFFTIPQDLIKDDSGTLVREFSYE